MMLIQVVGIGWTAVRPRVRDFVRQMMRAPAGRPAGWPVWAHMRAE